MAVNTDLIGSEVFPCHARFTVADGFWLILSPGQLTGQVASGGGRSCPHLVHLLWHWVAPL